MKTDAGSPDSIAMTKTLTGNIVGLAKGMTDNFPIHQVSGMENGQARHAFKRTGREVIIIADSDNIGVAVIGIDNRILVHAIAQIRVPHLRNIRHLCADRQRKGDGTAEI